MAPLCRPPLPRRLLALGFGLLCVWGCSHLRVDTDYDTDLDFSRFRTFAWLEPPVTSEPRESSIEEFVDPFERNSLLDKRVRQAVERELLARGYQRASDGQPDFELQYHVLLKDRMQVRSYPDVYYGHGRYPYYYGASAGGVSTYNYQEGTLIVDVIDAGTRQLAWRGWAVGVNRKGYYTDEKVGEAVRAVLERFPLQGSAAASDEK